MKIKTKRADYDAVMAKKRPKHYKPHRPNLFFRTLIRVVSQPDLWATDFSYTRDWSKDTEGGPYLILMNHSSFIDLKIAYRIFYPMPFCTVCTSDGFVGMPWLMRQIGSIPTQKFVSDLTLIRDMKYALKEKKTSVLMYPEASYTFDGCATPLPSSMGGLCKMLDVPVLMVTTHGAFARDPLYNGLQNRKVKVSADVKCLLTRAEIKEKTAEELNDIIGEAFTLDNFAWQYDNGVEIKEPFRADGLDRILYKCPACGQEGHMEGKGIHLTCHACGKSYELTTLGQLKATEGKTEYPHIPDWYRWERACVRREIEAGEYKLDTAVRIGMMVDYKAIYMVGEGRLVHDSNGFRLDGCDGRLHYEHKPLSSYGLYADYFWYEIGDVICIGNNDRLYYCFPEQEGVVAKTRMATEEIFKIACETARDNQRKNSPKSGE